MSLNFDYGYNICTICQNQDKIWSSESSENHIISHHSDVTFSLNTWILNFSSRCHSLRVVNKNEMRLEFHVTSNLYTYTYISQLVSSCIYNE